MSRRPREGPLSALRVALLHPTYWPEVTRGSERLIHDLAATLAGRGHEVTILTTHPAPTSAGSENGFRVVRSRRLPQPPTFGLHEGFLGNAPTVIWRLARGRFDVAQAFHLADAWAATRARRLGGPPVVFSYHGIPTRHHLVARRYRLELMQRVVADAEACTVLSEAAAEPFRRYLLRDPRIAPGGVVTGEFETEVARTREPRILMPASIGDPRKRGELLLEAFAALRSRLPDLRLDVIRTHDPFMSPLELELPDGAEWLELGAGVTLAEAYARSWVTVLPAVEEPFGLVLVESLAAGTPVVAARSGACPEIVTDARLGRIFEPDDAAGLEAALSAALELAGDAGTVEACRARAAEFDWSRVVERYEAVYEAALAPLAAGGER